VARFRVRRVKRRWRTRCRGGVEVGWWCVRGNCGGGVMRSQNVKWGGGLGQTNRNRATVALFWAATGLQEVERGAVGLQPPLPC
jgi:hypothetical protein